MKRVANSFNSLFTSNRVRREFSIMENILKELYKNLEEKLSCACLIHKDMKVIVVNYIRQGKPWLTQEDAEKKADELLKTSYQKYKGERNKPVNVLRRTFKKVLNNQPGCKCSKNITRCEDKPVRRSLNYKKLEESLNEEDCNCYITCAKEKPKEILQPLERFISTNRSFKLRMKHLDQGKYGHLNTANPDKLIHTRNDISQKDKGNLKLRTPNKSFKVEMENASTPNTKIPQYRFRFMPKSPTVVQENSKKCTKDTTFLCEQQFTKGNVSVTPKKNDQTYIKETKNEDKPNKTHQTEITIKMSHCDKHCFLCLLDEEAKGDPQLVYCENHCPKCVIENEAKSTIYNNSVKEHSSDTSGIRLRNKSERRLARKPKKPFPSKSVSQILDECLEKPGRRKNEKKRSNKENVNEFTEKEEIDLIANTSDPFTNILDEDMEWDSMGFVGELGNETNWGNTAGMLENIKNNHVNPIKEDLLEMQSSFRNLNIKYRL